MLTRRGVLQSAGSGLALAGAMAAAPRMAGAQAPGARPTPPGGTLAEAMLDSLPGKKPLTKLAYRPPNYESPLDYLKSPITANDEFFVRYHLADIPEVDARTWRLDVGGEGANGRAQLSFDELKKLPAFEVVAVCQCAGNRRGLSVPHVPGVQWGSGAMGCARWRGARLKDVLALAGLKPEAIEIVFDGADGPVVEATPDFVKSLPAWKALEDTTLVAYEMNGEPLPHWNGFPARIVVPGWVATYWVKQVTSIKALTKPFDGFWMKSAYRIPVGKFPLAQRFFSQESAVNTPIAEMVVNALITGPVDGASVEGGEAVLVSGLAWDGGYGVERVDLSFDGGASWRAATLGEDLGRFAFRPWSASLRARETASIMARATNRIGQTQPGALIENPGGYHNNVIQTVTLNVT